MTAAVGAPVVIRPVLARRVSFAVIPISVNLGVICGLAGAGAVSLGVRAAVAAIGLALAALCYAVQGRPRIVADAAQMQVRNLWGSRTVAWSQVAELTYTGRAPWPHARLETGETVALQALQRWDKEPAVDAAAALRRLLAQHRATSGAEEDRYRNQR